MAFKVIWTATAWRNLAGIADYIAKDSNYYAELFVREARDASRSLNQLPQRGRIVPEVKDKSVRELFVAHYRLIYQISGKDVSILAIIHGSRDLQALWRR